jgi:hypothetical protein
MDQQNRRAKIFNTVFAMRILNAWRLLIAVALLPCTAMGSGTVTPVRQQKCSYQVDGDMAVELTFSHRDSVYEPLLTATVKNLSKKENLYISNDLPERAPWAVLVYALGSNAVDITKRNYSLIEPSRMINRDEPLKMHRHSPKSTFVPPLGRQDAEIDLRNFIDEEKLTALLTESRLNISVDLIGPIWRDFDAVEANRIRANALSKARNSADCSLLSGVRVKWK